MYNIKYSAASHLVMIKVVWSELIFDLLFVSSQVAI